MNLKGFENGFCTNFYVRSFAHYNSLKMKIYRIYGYKKDCINCSPGKKVGIILVSRENTMTDV